MKKLILTDVDGTLTKKSIVLSHAGFLIENKVIADDGSYQAWVQDMKNEHLITSVAENYRSQIVGMKESDMKAKEFIENFCKTKENWYSLYNDLVVIKTNEAIKRKEEADIILITGSADFLIKHLASFLNVKYHATRYLKDENDCFTGEVIGMFSENQKDDCIQWNVNINEYSDIEAWGDTSSDYGLFKHADYTILVDPTRQTLETLITKQKIDKIIYA